MLVISRKKGESLYIGKSANLDDQEYIEIRISEVRGDKIRLAIDAPKEYFVHRKEVYEAIKKQREENSKKQNLETKL